MRFLPLVLVLALFILPCCQKKSTIPTAETRPAVEVPQAPASPESGTRYSFTPNSYIRFFGSKVTSSHAGGFRDFTGHFTLKDQLPFGTDHAVTIDMTSVWSDDPKLTEHLKTAEFFDIAKFPQATFEVTSIQPLREITADDGKPSRQINVSGNLDLHGVKKNITFTTEVRPHGKLLKINARFALNRQDFAIAYPGQADDLIRDEVVIELNLEAAP